MLDRLERAGLDAGLLRQLRPEVEELCRRSRAGSLEELRGLERPPEPPAS